MSDIGAKSTRKMDRIQGTKPKLFRALNDKSAGFGENHLVHYDLPIDAEGTISAIYFVNLKSFLC